MKKIAAWTTAIALIGGASSAFAGVTYFNVAQGPLIPVGTEDSCQSFTMHPRLDYSIFECQQIGRGTTAQFKSAGFIIQNVESHIEQTAMQGPNEEITFTIKKVK